MLPKERVKSAFAHQEPDRVPINYESNPGIDMQLKRHFGLTPEDSEGLLVALGVDFRGIAAPYVGPPLHGEKPDRRIDPEWGFHTRWIEHESGGYWDVCDFPLKDAGIEEVIAWPFPSPDDYDYAGLREQCRRHEKYGLYVGNASLACVMNRTGRLRSMDQIFIDLATDDPAGLLLIDRMYDVRLRVMERTLEQVGDRVEIMWIGEDVGTQRGPIISMDLYRRHLKPRHKKYVDLAKQYGLKVMIHCCGSSSWAFEEFIELGIDAVETLQPEAANMAPEYLKKNFGNRLVFHGGISTAGSLAYGTEDDVVGEVKDTLAIMKPGGGYCLAPTHMLQDNTPVENAVAMYRAAQVYGEYS